MVVVVVVVVDQTYVHNPITTLLCLVVDQTCVHNRTTVKFGRTMVYLGVIR